MKSRPIVVAAIQMPSNDWNPDINIERARTLIRRAAKDGANLVLCPELFMSPYFCIDENGDHFALAESAENNKKLAQFGALARELGIVLPVGFFERAGNAFYNSVAMFDADGTQLGIYRKTHIPDNPGYSEKFYFNPGDTGFKVWSTRFGRIGIGICWDQWFPESARSMSLMGAEVLCFPTIIGSNPTRPESDCSDHWQRVMQGHAAANAVPLVCANRIGTETGKGNGAHAPLSVTFYGRSFIADATGEKVAEADRTTETILMHTFELNQCQQFRDEWAFFRDRRPSMYGVISTSDGKNRQIV